MQGILSDVNIQGHVEFLIAVLRSGSWSTIWHELNQHATTDSLPVLTISDPERFHEDRAYIEKVFESLLDILLDIDAYRGTGRLYLP